MPNTCPCDPCACEPCTCGCGPNCQCGESCACRQVPETQTAAD